jgi:hypothetical protein
MEQTLRRNYRITTFGITLLLLICAIQSVTALTVSLENKEVQVGNTTTMNMVLDSAPTGLSGYGVTVSVVNPAIAEITNITVPSWGIPIIGGSFPSTSIQFGTFDWNLFLNPGAGHVTNGSTNVLLATLTVRGKSAGSTNLTIVPGEFEDVLYDSFTPTIVPGMVTVTSIPPPQYTITVTQGAHGTISPGTTVKNAGENQTFTITANSGYHVASVTVDGSSVGAVMSYPFTNIQANHLITASYAADETPQFTITVTQGAHGTISPGTTVKDAGESQTFTITPDPGYHIGLVTIDGEPLDAPPTFTFTNIQADHTITASYVANETPQYTITVTQCEHGTISPGTTVKNAGENQTFTITAGSGYHVESVTVDESSVGAVTSYKFTNIQADHTITASYAADEIPPSQFTITVNQGAHGTISPGTTVKNFGESQMFTIGPDLGYSIASVTVDGVSVGAINAYTFINIQADHTITASFAPVSPVTATGNVYLTSYPVSGLVFVDGTQYGQTPTLVVLPVGSHQVRINATGYLDAITMVNILERQTLFVPITLTPVSSGQTPDPTLTIIPVTTTTIVYPPQPQPDPYPFGFSSIIPMFGSLFNQFSNLIPT